MTPTERSSPIFAEPADYQADSNQPAIGYERRHQKILEYLDQAETKLGPLEANIAYINADLMSYVCFFREDLEQVRSLIADPRQRLEWLYQVTEQVYKITKQIDSLTQLVARLNRERQRKKGKRQDSHKLRLQQMPPVEPDTAAPPMMGAAQFSEAKNPGI
jgi:hypothetical protein